MKTVTMTGCLQPGISANSYALLGSITATGDGLKSKTTVKTDVDKNKTEVTTNEKTEVDDAHRGPVGTALATYELMPKEGVNLAPHLGHRVEITAVMLEPAKRGDDKAKVEIKEKTDVDVEHAPDAKSETRTKAELPRGPQARLMAMSIKMLAPSCTP